VRLRRSSPATVGKSTIVSFNTLPHDPANPNNLRHGILKRFSQPSRGFLGILAAKITANGRLSTLFSR
jgi:hypothetical protein